MPHAPTSPDHGPASARGAYAIVALLTGINLINYVDRYVLAAVGSQVIADLHLTQEQFGWIGTALIFSYTLLTPLCGWWGDRGSRTKLMAGGVGLWSLATALGGFATSFTQMLGARSLIGVGEASYASVTPSLIADYFKPEHRATPIGVFNAAIPVGTALGFILGGLLGEYLGWRYAFFIVGVPGLLLAAFAYRVREPVRGAMDSQAERDASAGRGRLSAVAGYLHLCRIPLYAFSVLGYTATTFAIGALAYWAPQLLQNDKGFTEKEAGVVIGIVAGGGGMVGTLAGGLFSDWLLVRTRHAYALVCAVTAAVAAVPMVIGIASMTPALYLPAIFLTVMIAFMGNAPVNAIIVNAVPADLRVSAVALSILAIHTLGDAISQPMVGAVSDRIRDAGPALPGFVASIASMFGLDPATYHLSLALLVLPVAMLVAAVFFALAMRSEGPAHR